MPVEVAWGLGQLTVCDEGSVTSPSSLGKWPGWHVSSVMQEKGPSEQSLQRSAGQYPRERSLHLSIAHPC